MRRLLRRIRGMLGTAITWGLGWIPFGAAWGVLDWFVGTDANALWYLVGAFGSLFGVMGFAGGAAFSLLLTSVERSRKLHQIPMSRFALWGGVGGIVVSTTQVVAGVSGTLTSLAGIGFVAFLGAASAVGTLRAARATDSPQLEAPSSSEPESSTLSLRGESSP